MLDLPEAANAEGAFPRVAIAIDQVAAAQLLTDAAVSVTHARRLGVFKAVPRQQKERRVHALALERGGIGAQRRIPRPAMQLAGDLFAFAVEQGQRRVWQEAFFRQR